jgi:hypothetical protein
MQEEMLYFMAVNLSHRRPSALIELLIASSGDSTASVEATVGPHNDAGKHLFTRKMKILHKLKTRWASTLRKFVTVQNTVAILAFQVRVPT